MPTNPDFFFDKTSLFNKITTVENIVGVSAAAGGTGLSSKVSNLELLVDGIVAEYSTKEYVDTSKISKFGDRMQGELVLANLASLPYHAVPKQQLDETVSTVVQTGDLDW